METGPGVVEAISSPAKERIFARLDAWLSSLALLERSKGARKLVDLSTRGIDVEPIPACLDEAQRAIVVSNYPSVSQTLRAVLKVACRLPGEEFRLKGIGRPEAVTHANAVLKALGVGNLILPVHKDKAGVYRLRNKIIKDVLAHVDGTGHVLWMSVTGRTQGNGLLEGDLRTGAALFSARKGVPLVPMGLVTREKKGRLRVVKIRFGEPIDPPDANAKGDFERADFLMDFSRLALCHVAKLLPPGQRGDFEKVDEKLEETERRLGIHEG